MRRAVRRRRREEGIFDPKNAAAVKQAARTAARRPATRRRASSTRRRCCGEAGLPGQRRDERCDDRDEKKGIFEPEMQHAAGDHGATAAGEALEAATDKLLSCRRRAHRRRASGRRDGCGDAAEGLRREGREAQEDAPRESLSVSAPTSLRSGWTFSATLLALPPAVPPPAQPQPAAPAASAAPRDLGLCSASTVLSTCSRRTQAVGAARGQQAGIDLSRFVSASMEARRVASLGGAQQKSMDTTTQRRSASLRSSKKHFRK